MLKYILATCTLIAGSVSFANAADNPIQFKVDRSIVNVKNAFTRNNPLYKQRAGAYYEEKYVTPAVERLVKIANVKPEQLPGTLDSLQAFVYDWLDNYVRGNGSINANQVRNCVDRMDRRFDILFSTEKQRNQYREWRDEAVNPLNFLIKVPSDQ